jgi:hypothetical protein
LPLIKNTHSNNGLSLIVVATRFVQNAVAAAATATTSLALLKQIEPSKG